MVRELLIFRFLISSMKAIWNGSVIAESDDTIVIENNHYFPPDAVKQEFFVTSGTHTICPWKGKRPISTSK